MKSTFFSPNLYLFNKRNLVLFVYFLCFSFVQSCKRSEIQGTNEIKVKHEAAVASFRAKFRNVISFETHVPINEKVPTLIMDKKGNSISWEQYRFTQEYKENLALRAPEDCNEAPDPATALEYWYQMNCANGTYTIKAKWKVIVPADILVQSPINSNNKTAGRIRYFNSSGTQIANSNYIYDNVQITFIQETLNSNSVEANEYEVVFTAPNIPYADINNAAYIRVSLRYYTSCGGAAYVTGEPMAGLNTYQNGSNPCVRNDKVWINPPQGGTWGAIGGTNATGICLNQQNWVNPNTHIVKIFDITNGGNSQITGSPFTILNTEIKPVSALQVGKKYRFEYQNRIGAGSYPWNGSTTCLTAIPQIEIWQF